VSINLLVLPGDGIGPEITEQVLKTLRRLDALHELDLLLDVQDVGLSSLEQHGTTFRDEVMATARRADGVIMAPMATYEYPAPEAGGVNPSARMRSELDLYANIRPARVFEGVPAMGRDMDLVVVRENTEGFYADRSMHLGLGEMMPTPDLAIAVRKITRQACRRIARAAFDMALRRRQRVTMVHKANVLRVSDGLFKSVVEEVAADFPDVTLEECLIDAMAAMLIRKPSSFDVVVTTNMYGDILSDEATELAGGIGLGGAINAGDEHAMAQATHGSAPDIAGQNKANPTALLLSTAMLLGWLGGRLDNEGLGRASQALEAAVARALSDPAHHTPDLGGSAGTDAFGDAVVAALG
jgi:3-isopropylmalate dehydrogenase